jgi:hypothetical protein
MCEITKSKMGHEKGEAKDKARSQNKYKELLKKGSVKKLDSRYVQPVYNNLWDYPICDVYQLWQPDVLHQFLLGLVKHVMEWLIWHLKDVKLLSRFDKRFKSIPPYPGFYPFRRSYSEVSSWQGKEIRTMLRFLVAAVGPLLTPYTTTTNSRHLRKDHNPDSITVLRCTRALTELVLVLSQYNHSDVTLQYLQKTLKTFYKAKFVFRPYRMTKARKAKFQKKWSKVQEDQNWTDEQRTK